MGLPNFLHVGAAKTGTTSTYFYLRQHPEIFMSPRKGPEFFVSRFSNGHGKGPGDGAKKTIDDEAGYRALFEGADGARIIGESSVSYLYHHREAIPLIRSYLGDPRILITLRNPADLAFSSYIHLLRQGRETCSFEAGLEAESGRVAQGWHYHWHYSRLGLFSDQVAAYLQNFSRVHVFLLEDMAEDPQSCMRQLYEFLGVDSRFQPDTSVRYNQGGVPRWRSLYRVLLSGGKTRPVYLRGADRVMDEQRLLRWRERLRTRMLVRQSPNAETRQALLESYRSDVQRLESLLGRDLMGWFDRGGRPVAADRETG
jgi:hypothetical protein